MTMSTRLHHPLFTPMLFLVGCVLLSSLLWSPFRLYDEGIIMVGAQRILAGENPYLDFWSLYPPGQFYTVAMLLDHLEQAPWVWRTYDIVIKALIGVVSFMLIDRLTRQRKLALSIWLFTITWIGFRDFALYPIFPCLLFVLLSLLYLIRYLDEGRRLLLMTSTSSLVIAAFYRVDLGILAGFAILLGLLLRSRVLPQGGLHALLAWLGACLLFAIPAMGLLHLKFGIPVLFDQLIAAPAKLIPDFRALPYPAFGLSSKKLPFYFFPVLLMIGLGLSLRDIIAEKTSALQSHALLLISLIGISFMNQAMTRSDFIHLMPSAVAGIIVLGLLWHRLRQSTDVTLKTRKTLTAILIILMIAIFFKPFYKQSKEVVAHFVNANKALRLCDDIICVRASKGLRETTAWLAHHTAPTDPIYVGVTNHDRFTVNDVALYMLAHRLPATRYHELHPGVTTTSEVQAMMVEELKARGPGVAILRENFSHEPNLSSEDTHNDILDAHIRRHYRHAKTLGDFQIWLRSDNPAPGEKSE